MLLLIPLFLAKCYVLDKEYNLIIGIELALRSDEYVEKISLVYGNKCRLKT